LDDAFVTELSQLKDVPFITSLEIKAGIAHYISSNVSTFKEAYKARKSAAEDLLSFSSAGAGATGRYNMSGAGSGEDDDDANFFVDY